MQIVVPMAGLGKRFSDVGYTMPKPLIPVSGMPMVARAVRDQPTADRVIFICHPDHVAQFRIDEQLKEHFPQSRIVVAPGLTEGQACSVRMAGEYLDPDDAVTVIACDNTHLYDAARLNRLTDDPNVDCLVWTYRRDPRVLVRPEWYGWVRVGENNSVLEVSCKRPISPAPLQDHVVSGCFWFRSGRLLCEGIDALIAANQRVNGEFYMDVVPNLMIARGVQVRAFEVAKYIGWGTPDDLEDYNRWQSYFDRRGVK